MCEEAEFKASLCDQARLCAHQPSTLVDKMPCLNLVMEIH